jgi:hypothetical protein
MYQFEDIDIADSKRANGYVHYLVALQNLDPICLDAPISKEHQSLIDEMKRVCSLIEAYLPKCEPKNLRAYAGSYAMIYTFGKLKQLDPKVLDELDFRILDAWMNGDKQIPEIEAYDIIGRHRNEVAADLRSWHQRKQAEYFLAIDEAGKFANLSPAENYRTLTALCHDSIWEQFPDCHYGWGDVAVVNFTDDIKSLDTETLCEYYHFQDCYSLEETPHRVKLQRDSAILAELSQRPELDEFDRKGYALDKQAIDAYVAEEFEDEIAEIAARISAPSSELSSAFQSILTDMFDELPQFVDGEGLDFKGGKLLAPVSNDAMSQIVDIHFALMNADVQYDEFIFTNVLNELEQRTNASDAIAHEIVAHYDDLYHKYNG